MRKLVKGDNVFSLALDYDLSALTELTFRFYYTYGDLYDSIKADVLGYDCFNGIVIVNLKLLYINDGEYNVSVYDGDSLLYKGLFNVFSYVYADAPDGVVIGSDAGVDTSGFTITTEVASWLMTEDGLVLIT